jgi:hypothetical protein
MSGIKKKISMYESNGNIALKTTHAARRSLFSGTVSAFVSAFAASMAGKYEDTSFAAPLNAISHILWGDKAAHKDDAFGWHQYPMGSQQLSRSLFLPPSINSRNNLSGFFTGAG